MSSLQVLEAAVLAASNQWRHAKAVALPIRDDGTKAPAMLTWEPYCTKFPSDTEHSNWFSRGTRQGLGVIMGAASGGLEMFEFEGHAITEGVRDQYGQLCQDNGLADLWDRVQAGYTEVTPSGGAHYIWRVTDGPVPGNTKLASRLTTEPELAAMRAANLAKGMPADKATKAVQLVKVLIETRGEGGQVVVAPSGGATHKTGRPWQMLTGGVDTIACVTLAERDALVGLARMLHTVPARVEQAPAAPRARVDARGNPLPESPLDKLERTLTWEAILEPEGWTFVKQDRDGTSYWLRPGRDTGDGDYGWSASTGHDSARDRLFIWSTSTTLEAEKPHSKPYVYAHYRHDGDLKAAARAFTAPRPAPVSDDDVPWPDEPGHDTTARPAAVRTGVWVIDREWDCHASHTNPRRVAEAWLDATGFQLHYWREAFYRYSSGRWKRIEAGRMMAMLWSDLGHAFYMSKDKKTGEWEQVNFTPTEDKVTGVRKAIEALVYRPTKYGLDAQVVFNNGALDLTTGVLGPYTASVFNVHKVQADYDPAAVCPNWDAFIASSLPDADQRDVLQEVIGYLLSGRQDLHKIFGFWGEKRSGKSTIMRTLERIMGRDSVTSTRYASLIGPFGLQSHTESSVIVVNEARVTKESKSAVDLLLAISGGDGVEVNVKNKPIYTATLPGRLVMVSNVMPNVMDESDAFASRFVHLMFTVSFYGREDHELEDRLKDELPGIVAWALRGLERLKANGNRFTASTRHVTADRQLSVSVANLPTWFAECVKVTDDPDDVIDAQDLRVSYVSWCQDNDIEELHIASETRLGTFLTNKTGRAAVKRRVATWTTRSRCGLKLLP